MGMQGLCGCWWCCKALFFITVMIIELLRTRPHPSLPLIHVPLRSMKRQHTSSKCVITGYWCHGPETEREETLYGPDFSEKKHDKGDLVWTGNEQIATTHFHAQSHCQHLRNCQSKTNGTPTMNHSVLKSACVWVCVCVCAPLCMWECFCMCLCLWLSVGMCLFAVCVHLCICVYSCVCVCMRVCVRVPKLKYIDMWLYESARVRVSKCLLMCTYVHCCAK